MASDDEYRCVGEEAERWKQIALYLADCHAATAYSLPKSTSKSARKRFQSICATSLKMLQREVMPPQYKTTNLESVVKRLQGALRDGG